MITDTEARRIASEWHDGQWTGLYALSSSGAIIVNGNFNTTPKTFIDECGDLVLAEDPDTLATLTAFEEINHDLDSISGDDAAENGLYDLQDYILTNGPRGPVEGWSNLTW